MDCRSPRSPKGFFLERLPIGRLPTRSVCGSCYLPQNQLFRWTLSCPVLWVGCCDIWLAVKWSNTRQRERERELRRAEVDRTNNQDRTNFQIPTYLPIIQVVDVFAVSIRLVVYRNRTLQCHTSPAQSIVRSLCSYRLQYCAKACS